MQFPGNVEEALKKADSLYYIRPYEAKDYDAAREIFSEGMLEYGPEGGNMRRKTFQSADAEVEADYAREIALCYPSYVNYNLQHANMMRQGEYWSLSRRSAFLMCVERATEKVVGTVGIQPLELCGMDDSYVSLALPFSQEVDKDVEGYEQKMASHIPSALYCLDNPAYDSKTYKPLQCIVLPGVLDPLDVTHVENDMTYAVSANTAQETMNSMTFKCKVPNGYFRRFQPCSEFSVPLPKGMTVHTYTDVVQALDLDNEENAAAGLRSIAQDTADNAYNYFYSLGCAEDLPSAARLHRGYQECELRRMSVTHAHRGNGAAELLIFTALQMSAKVFRFDALHLSTSYVMDRAVHFYRRMGFRQLAYNQEDVGQRYPMPIVHFRYEFALHAHKYNVFRYFHSAHDE